MKGATQRVAGSSVKNRACKQAKEWCIPFIVFDDVAAKNFREALRHMDVCREADCLALQEKVKAAMAVKLSWLKERGLLLGCSYARTGCLGSYAGELTSADFYEVIRHLSACEESLCVQLRRALLLAIRKTLGAHRGFHGVRQPAGANVSPADKGTRGRSRYVLWSRRRHQS